MDFHAVIVLHDDSYMSHRVSGVTQIMSQDLFMSSLYKSRLSEERLYTEVKGLETRALHATIYAVSLPILYENKTLYAT